MDRTRGVTLIELMVTLSVMAILMAVGAPSLQTFVRNNQLRTAANEMQVALGYARSEAIKRGVPVTVCKSADISAVSPACSSSNAVSWRSGWLVFADLNQDGVVDTSGTTPDTVLRVGGGDSSGPVITPSGFTHFVSYLPGGTAVGGSGVTSGSFGFCHYGEGLTLEVSVTGRAQMSQVTC